ncbi:HEAT repeat domain-containing protein [Chryseobacterium gotjawalense]|uniref:HEAT repeat domain-containing protein n=1 Tax=Chryseobacterium gotjawalense TaxID=3042315 RepID=A0ABY8RB44_9FLAO|nr:HEAT repeat domain-containing protein [Chryseobacterium sp. wdc7]WHF50302.1 HEAT repeat domain-containing protein [Chryseobacterium sp. wdc7]
MLFLDISLHFLFDTFLGILLIVFLLILGVLYYSFYLFKKLIDLINWSQEIDYKVTQVIVHGSDELEKTDADRFSQFSNNSSFRDLFLEKLVDSEKKFSGAAQNEINKLFQDYNLEKEAFEKLDQKKPYLIAGGIQELTSMRVETAVPKINSLLTHSSSLVYQEAQYAMVSFKGFDGLQFLDTASNMISEWQQLRLLLSVSHIPENGDDSFKNWLRSENNSVIIFTLRLARKFQMLSFYSEILNLLDHSSEQVRIQAVQTLQSLENPSTVNDLTASYTNQTPDVQVEIIKVLKIAKDQRAVVFLKKQLIDHPFPKLKIFAAEALFSLGHETFLMSLAENESSPEQLIQIIKHSMQEKVC